MSKYKNKRLHISAFDIVFAVIFLCLLIASAFSLAEYRNTKGKFNIKQTKVDYIIEAPSREQIAEIEARNDVDSAVPYVYRSDDIIGNKKTINSSLYIIDNADDLNYTVFSDDLKVTVAATQLKNPLYVSSDLANNAGLSLNDSIKISVSGSPIEFTISGIYKSDYRNVGGTAITIMQDDIKNLYGDDYRYTGAYISSNDISATKSYLANYIGMGDLRSSEEFDSDDAYQIYLENRKKKSSSESTFSSAEFVKELERRYNSKLMREYCLNIGFIAGAAMVLLINILSKSRKYAKNDVKKDIRNNFTLEQEKQMFNRYNTWAMLVYLLAVAAFIVVSYFMFGNELLSLNNLIVLCVTILSAFIARGISICSLSKQFSIVSDKIRKESAGN